MVSALTGCGDDDPSTPPDATVQPPDAGDQPDAAAPDAGGPLFDETKKTEVLSTGITMAYVEAGNTSGAETVILLHGYTDTSRSFFPTIEALMRNDTQFHVYALDQRGHGGSSMPDGANCPAAPEDCFELTDMADDVIAFMDAKSIETAHIVGHSMSSLVAQELALANPERVESLMLIGTWVYAEENPAFTQFLIPQVEGTDADMGQWRGLLEAGDPQFQWPDDAYNLTLVDADPNGMDWVAMFWAADPTADPAFVAKVVPETTATKLGTWIGALRNQFAHDTRDRMAELTVPTLIIWATQDSLFLNDPDQVNVRTAFDAAVDACNLEYYYYKTYGKEPLPPSGFQESDIGHNVQWGAYEGIADDITSWVTNGEPTEDLPYADPNDVGTVLNEAGTADIVEKRQPDPCTPAR